MLVWEGRVRRPHQHPRLPAARAPPEPRRPARDPARDRRSGRADTRRRARVRRHARLRPRRPAALGELAGERAPGRADRERASPGPECRRRPLPRQLRRGPQRATTGADGTLERAVRAAATLAGRHLARRDRVGLVTFGGVLRWLEPGFGLVQRYRLIDALLETGVEFSYAWKDVNVIPARTLPPKALVLAVTPLLDERSIAALLDLAAPRARPRRDRGFARGARGAGAGARRASRSGCGCSSAPRSALASSAPASRSRAGPRTSHSTRGSRG